MSDMRQKLLPVFLEEAGRKILQLDAFLSAAEGESKSLEDLEAAFRAAHTLKGTAALVQAEAICSLGARIEGLLEGHFEHSRFPSEVECEAMRLALDRLRQLVSAIEKGSAEPPGITAEAELALKLAAAMPGRKRLVELLEQQQQKDPFAEDPQLDSTAAISATMPTIALVEDPFADDPSFDAKPHLSAPADDPFADDPSLEFDPEVKAGPEPVIADSFAGDPALEIAEPEGDRGTAAAGKIVDPFGDDPTLEPVIEMVREDDGAGKSAMRPAIEDPFAEDPELVVESADEVSPGPKQEESFAERMRKRIEKESPLGTAERLTTTLLLQKEGDVTERNFACCRFRVAEKDYYLPIASMVEIADLPAIIRLPLAPPIVRGLINLRGRVLPLIDLAVQSGTASAYVAVHKAIVADTGGEQLAFLTDGIPDLSEEITGEKVDVKRFIEQFRAGAS